MTCSRWGFAELTINDIDEGQTMTSGKKKPILGTDAGLTNWRLHSTEVEVELEKLDRRAGHQYVPMDIYLDPGTINAHFHVSSICDRWSRTHLNNA